MLSKEYIYSRDTHPKKVKKSLPRHNIDEKINNASLDEMIYIAAPYGSGKTMSVISWLRAQNKIAAWVSLETGRISAIAFWALFSASILVYAGEYDTADNIINNPHFAEDSLRFAYETLNRPALANSDKILIIDNFDLIRDNGLLLDLKNFIKNLLGCWRIILISRGDLPPAYNDFMLKRRMCMITMNELYFDLEEIHNYFLLNGVDVDKENIHQIHKDTDGWPAALNAILTVPHNSPLRFNNHAKAYINDFFQAEIWEQLSDETISSFLMKTSILDKLTPSICHYITGIEDTYQILMHLHGNGVFITKLDELNTYCYHRIFRDFLMDKLLASGTDINYLYMTVGWWLYEKNESISALTYFYKSKNILGINMAFKKIKPADIGMEKYLEAAMCLTTLDISSLKDYPEVAARIALLHFITNNIAESHRIYKIIQEWFEPGSLAISSEEYIDLFWEVGWLMYIDPDEDIFFNSTFEDWINFKKYAPHLQGSDRSRASALRLPSALRGPRDFSRDIVRLEEYYKKNNEAENRFIRDEAFLFILALAIAEVAYEREDFTKAERIINEILPKIEDSGYIDLYLSATYLLVKLCRAAFNPNEIDSLTVRAKTLIMNNKHYFLLPNFHALELRNSLACGVPGMTTVFEDENKPYNDKTYYYLIYRHITFVRALLSENKYNEANLILGNLDMLCRKYKRNMDLIEINILRSIAEYGLENGDGAYQYIKSALDAGRKNGLIRIFSDDAISLWPIMNLIHKYKTDAYIKKIIASCKKTLNRAGSNIQTEQNIYEILTRAEISILKLLASGMSYEEIAIHSNIKKGTVKVHLHSIYSKLNVEGKFSAIMKAQKLGIFVINPEI